MIHYKDELFYVGVNEERKATVAVEDYLKNFFDGKEYVIANIELFVQPISNEEPINKKIFDEVFK